MNLKPVVKLMNFHALLRVDNAKRRADLHLELEREITDFLSVVMNNRNFQLDMQLFRPNPSKPSICVYIGSDFGFCGALNNRVNQAIASDTDTLQIIIGRKLTAGQSDRVLLACDRGEYEQLRYDIHELLVGAIASGACSSVDLVYNRYINISNIELVRQNIFPLAWDGRPESVVGQIRKEADSLRPGGQKDSDGVRDPRYTDDFVVEGDVNELLVDLVVSYIDSELMIALENSYASENIMRQDITTQSLDKIDEIEEEAAAQESKERRRKQFIKVLDSYTKTGNFK